MLKLIPYSLVLENAFQKLVFCDSPIYSMSLTKRQDGKFIGTPVCSKLQFLEFAISEINTLIQNDDKALLIYGTSPINDIALRFQTPSSAIKFIKYGNSNYSWNIATIPNNGIIPEYELDAAWIESTLKYLEKFKSHIKMLSSYLIGEDYLCKYAEYALTIKKGEIAQMLSVSPQNAYKIFDTSVKTDLDKITGIQSALPEFSCINAIIEKDLATIDLNK
jgi:predicted transcriptional regulator